MGISNRDWKNPKYMNNIELLETYSHFTKINFRLDQEQEYLTKLRNELLERMKTTHK